VTGPRPELTAEVVATFDEAADHYDSTGSGFAGPVAARLVELARLRPGWRVLDAGCGAGAVLVRAAEAVSPGGTVAGIDLAPAMLARAAREAGRAGVRRSVTLLRCDAAAPAFGPASFDAILASLVFYLLPDQAAALARWRELLVPGGTLAFSRGVLPDPRWSPVFAAVDAHASHTGWESYLQGPGPLSATTAMLDACGYTGVTSLTETMTYRYDSPEHWWDTCVSEGPRLTWRHIPAQRLAQARAEALAMAQDLREPDGSLLRHVGMAYLVAHRPDGG